MIDTKTLEESKILVVDSNPTNIMLLERILNIRGYKNIRTLMDSREVLNVYSEYQPDLMLLELKMPYYNGFEILEKLRDITPDYLPVILITEQDDIENRLNALRLGAQDFIAKPFNNAEVLLRVSNFLEVTFYNKYIKSRNERLEGAMREKSDILDQMQNELIERLLRAAEFRDQETGNHISRISKYAFLIGKKLGLSDEAAGILEQASLMHDIGKIGVPDEILNKPERLNSSEWEKMKAHTTKGAKILSGSSSKTIQLAEQIALTHHEKWDGTGYPNGLSGTQIPLSGRIIALADVFDALISIRPYKSAWTLNDAIEYIRSQSGTHFDPDVVNAFIACLPEFIRIKDELK